MLQHIIRHKLKMLDLERIEAVNASLLSHDMPIVSKGVLYIDGEGTATALVAKEAAELFNAGNYDCVVMAGERRPHADPKKKHVFPKVEEEGLDLPEVGDTEAEYAAREFRRYADPDKWAFYNDAGKIHVFPSGNAASQKVQACSYVFNKVGLVQCVTLPYTVQRLVGTFAQYAPNVAVTAKGVWPFGLTPETWKDWGVSYAVVMDEADKTGPRLDGKKPKYEDKFFKRVDLKETGDIAWRLDNGLEV